MKHLFLIILLTASSALLASETKLKADAKAKAEAEVKLRRENNAMEILFFCFSTKIEGLMRTFLQKNPDLSYEALTDYIKNFYPQWAHVRLNEKSFEALKEKLAKQEEPKETKTTQEQS